MIVLVTKPVLAEARLVALVGRFEPPETGGASPADTSALSRPPHQAHAAAELGGPMRDKRIMKIRIDSSQCESLVDQIVDGVRNLVDNRTLRPGTRLPSIRRFAADHDISKFTVVQAYDRLVACGYVQPRQGAGFFVTAPGAVHAPTRGRSGAGQGHQRALADAPPGLCASIPAPARWRLAAAEVAEGEWARLRHAGRVPPGSQRLPQRLWRSARIRPVA